MNENEKKIEKKFFFPAKTELCHRNSNENTIFYVEYNLVGVRDFALVANRLSVIWF